MNLPREIESDDRYYGGLDHDDGPEPELEPIDCPLCGTDNDPAECFLGILGDITHCRCRYCGGDWEENHGVSHEV